MKCLSQVHLFSGWFSPCGPALEAVESVGDGTWLEKEGRRGQPSAITSVVSLPGLNYRRALRHIFLLLSMELAQDPPPLANMDGHSPDCEPLEPSLPKLLSVSSLVTATQK